MSPILPGDTMMAFEALEDFLISDQTPGDCMAISDLDGFLTGVAISPELIMPSEWVPRIWGDGAPDFKSEEEANQVMGAIMERYNEILGQLSDGGDGQLEPIFWEFPGRGIMAGDWAEGFVDAMRLRPERWLEILGDKSTRNLLAPILALACDDEGGSFIDIGEDALGVINDEAPSLIPAAVHAFDQAFKARREDGEELSGEEPLRFNKIGQNEPCPCGSGRKYKRCCGAN